MDRSDLDATDREIVTAAADHLRRGRAIVVPTDTVYGLAASPSVPGATDQLWRLKGRRDDKPMAVLVADAEQGLGLLDLPVAPRRLVEAWINRCWPGALTIVAPRSTSARHLELGSTAADTIGVRCPADPIVRAITARTGPIAATSANRSGQPAEVTAAAAAASLLGEVAFVVDGGPGGTVASTVVDVTNQPWRLLREGAIPASALAEIADTVAAGEQ